MFCRVLILLLFFVFFLNTSAYQIDKSCHSKGVGGDIRYAMTSAFSMVDSALSHLNQDPYDQDAFDLIKRLFLPKEGQDPNDRTKMTKVKRIFENINANYRHEIQSHVPLTGVPRTDVVSLMNFY